METSYWRYRLKREWQLVLVLPFLALVGWGVSKFAEPPGGAIPDGAVAVPAAITSVTLVNGRRGINMIVAARSSDGLTTETAVPMDLVVGCRAGDPIKAWRKGVILYVSPEPCRHAASSASN